MIAKSLRDEDLTGGCELLIVGSWELVRREVSAYTPGVKPERLESVPEGKAVGIGVLDIGSADDAAIVPGKPSQRTSRLAGRAVEAAAGLAIDGRVDGIVTAPLTKRAFAEIGSPHLGHTEYLAWRTRVSRFGMMFVQDRLKVVLVTTHLPLARVPLELSEERIVVATVLLEAALRSEFGIARPRLAVAGLNPHGGEEGLLGHEEEIVIRPAVEACQARGLEVSGPLPAETLFWRMQRGELDGVVAMYHDQALVPVKLLGAEQAVNVTLGLPFVRTSVGHGTGFDIAGGGSASETSMVEALRLAGRMAARRIQEGA